MVEPEQHRVRVLGLQDDRYEERDASALLGVGATEITQALNSPLPL